jgi:hypothetical protein
MTTLPLTLVAQASPTNRLTFHVPFEGAWEELARQAELRLPSRSWTIVRRA